MATVLLEAKPYRPFKSSEEYLEAMKEDLAEWLNIMYPELNINAENFMSCLDTGVALCKHANNVRNAAEEYLAKRQARNKSMTKSITSGLAGPILANLNVHYLPAAKSGTFFARDNVSNFITWCRKSLKILECLLFETDDLIMRKNEKHVILCLLEVARRGAKFGMLAPMLVQMERQIDREIAADYKANGSKFILQIETDDINQKNMIQEDLFESDSEDEIEEPMLLYGPQPQIITNDLKSLDEMVRDLVEKCTCPSQFPMVRVSEGKYRIGDTKVLIFVRILRSHVMVRVGGGWDTLAHYLDKHDPCRCRSAHRTSVAARLIPRISNQNNIELHKAQVIYERSPPATRKTLNSQPFCSTFSNLQQITNTASPTTSLLNQNKSRSPTPQKKFINQQQNTQNGNGSYLFSTSPIANLTRRSMSPSPRKLTDIRKKQTTFDTNNQLKLAVDMPSITNNYVQTLDNLSQIPTNTTIAKEEFSPSNNFPEVHLNSSLNKSASNYDNTSDNGSEISDEGYRSLGLQQINNQKYELQQNPQMDDAEYKARPYLNACDSQISSKENRNKINDNIKNVGNNTDKIDSTYLSPSTNEQRKLMIKTEFDNNDHTNIEGFIDSNSFEQSGIFITDDDITVDIAGATGLRKTGFSNKIYGGPDDLSYLCPKTTERKPIISEKHKPEILAKIPINNSKIPRSPKITRRRSIDVSGEKNNFISNGNCTGFNRMQPEYRSNRLIKQLSSDEKYYQSKTIINNGTWNGRNKKKLYPGLNDHPIRSSSLNSHFDKKSKQVNSHILYDSNGKRVCSKSTSLTTSPVKSKNINSPLAQQLLKVANNAKNDAQMLEKMKIILQKYGNESTINSTTTNTTTTDKKTPKNFNCNNSYTSEWVHNNGDLNRSDSSLSSSELKKSNELNKNNSISVTPLELKNCKNNSALNSNPFIPITPKSRIDHRGLSKIPAPIRRNTELY